MENQNPKENKNFGNNEMTIKKVNNRLINETIFIFERSKNIPKTNITKALKREGTIPVRSKYTKSKNIVINNKSYFFISI